MILVIFEVEIKAGKQEAYLEIAAGLRPLLAQVDGFISVERFQSLSAPEKLLSLSCWRDEAAVKAWRETAEHKQAQSIGRSEVFAKYNIRVASVIRDYAM